MKPNTKVIAKVELKPLTEKDKEYIDSIAAKNVKLVRILNSYIKYVCPLRVYSQMKMKMKTLRKDTYRYIDRVVKEYGIKPRIYY